ncbi:BglG family transcription antiterminator [Oceanobacillus longus]|uniref:BglG family transcription antiterminator n=1 Tax=Oceanobacillus longus TaxID=930120 RepID=A0ABV8H4F9_9BACI
MNERQKKLLQILLDNHNAVVQIQDLAERLDCSEKTVRNDLKYIEGHIQEFSDAIIVRKPGIGVYLVMDEAERSLLFQRLSSRETKTQEERTIEIGYQLLTNEKPITLQHLANRYYVPKATIKKDIEEIAGWLKRFDIELVSKQRLGSATCGSELNRRSALAHLSRITTSSDDKSYVLDMFQPYEITTVRKLLQDMQLRYSIAFTDGAMESLLVHALIMIKRTRERSTVYISDEDKGKTQQTAEYDYIRWFTKQLEMVLKITLPENERVYFTWHLISSKKHQGLNLVDVSVEQEILTKVVNDLVAKVNRLTMTNYEADSILINGLTIHMHSVLNRINYGFPITNPLLAEIKKMYPYMFGMVVLALQDIKVTYNLDIPEDEAAYLVLHFQASVERMEVRREKRKKVLIVCHLGTGMSRLLEAKIKHHYQDIQVVSCIGKSDVHEYLKTNRVDIVISTVSLEKVNVPSIVISPLLEAQDRDKLNRFFDELENKKALSRKASGLMKLVERENIHLQVKQEHRFEIVEMLGNALYKKRYVEQAFTHSALIRERTSATSIGGGIAIPHGQPDLITKSTISIAVLEKPLEWGHEVVSVVFLIAISNEDHQQTREAISDIAAISEKPSIVKALVEAGNVNEFLKILESKTS